ncbi:hypothetical protein E2320_022153, partial [Naja naja]
MGAETASERSVAVAISDRGESFIAASFVTVRASRRMTVVEGGGEDNVAKKESNILGGSTENGEKEDQGGGSGRQRFDLETSDDQPKPRKVRRMTGLPLLLLLLFWLLPPVTAKRMQTGCGLTRSLDILEDYYRPGDFIIGGNLPLATIVLSSNGPYFQRCPSLRDLPIINPKESPQYVGLVQLLLYFQWNWVGLVAPENHNGERFISSLTPMLQEKEICLAFIEMMKSDFLITMVLKLLSILKTWSKSEVIILFGESNSIINVLSVMNAYKQETRTSFCKVWILTCHWKVSVVVSQHILKSLKFFHGSLHFRDHTGDVLEFSHFLLSLDPLNPQGDIFLPQ